MPGARAASLAAMATAAAANPRLFEPNQGLEEAVTRLRALPGIGEWTAQYIAMRALREPDAFPAADIGLLRALATADGRPTPGPASGTRRRVASPGAPMPRCISGPPMPNPPAWSPNMIFQLARIPSPIGEMLLVFDGEAVRALDFHDYEPRIA